MLGEWFRSEVRSVMTNVGDNSGDDGRIRVYLAFYIVNKMECIGIRYFSGDFFAANVSDA